MKNGDILANLPTLETERLILRKLREEDEEDRGHFRYASDPEICRYTSWHSHRSREDTRAFLQNLLDGYRRREAAPWGLVDKRTYRVIGTIGFAYWDVVNARAEVAYALSRTYWNRSSGTISNGKTAFQNN